MIKFSNKIFEYGDLDKLAEELKKTDKKVVLVGGCFDILHIGHVKFLEAARKCGDVLIVALESDEKTKILKGEGRPINSQEIRAEMLAAIDAVGYVLKLPGDVNYLEFTKKLNPSILAVAEENLKIKKIADKLKMEYVMVIDKVSNVSTSKFARLLGME